MIYNFGKNLQKISSEKYSSTNHIGLAIYYAIFLILIPVIITKLYGFNSLKLYLPTIDLVANILTSSAPELFNDLYELNPDSITSYSSTNFINLISLIGVSWNGAFVAIKRGLYIGVLVTVAMFMITYLLPTQLISIIEGSAYKWTKQYFDKDPYHVNFKYVRYISGFIFATSLVIIEAFIIQRLILT